MDSFFMESPQIVEITRQTVVRDNFAASGALLYLAPIQVGLFTAIKDQDIGAKVAFIRTTGFGAGGVGAAIYRQAGEAEVLPASLQDKAWSADASGRRWVIVNEVAPEQVGVLSSDASTVIQAAADAAETWNIPLRFNKGVAYTVRGTVYLGSISILMAGAKVDVIIDNAYTQRGTADRRAEGVFLTKASSGAGYGQSTTSIKFDELNFATVKTLAAATPKAGVLLENVSGLVGASVTATATGQGTHEVVPLDFYAGVQNVDIDRMRIEVHNGQAPGGFWIRNSSTTRDTANINIGNLTLSGESGDELMAIFNSVNGAASIHDIRIDFVGVLIPIGGRGQAVSVYDIGSFTPEKFRNISFGMIDITVDGVAPGVTTFFVVKADKTAPRFCEINIVVNGVWPPSVKSAFGILGVAGAGQTMKPSVGRATIRTNGSSAPLASGAAIYGPIDYDSLTIEGDGTGFAHGAYDVGRALNVRISGSSYAGYAVFGADRIEGSVDGRLRDVGVFISK